jgi:uncharacterized membrane protein (UPF0127 family)
VPKRVGVAAAAVVALLALAGMVAVVVRVRADDSGVGHLRFASTQPAAAPFASFGEARVALGAQCLRTLVATTPAQRTQGLREVRSLAPYDAMLFVEQHDSTGLFTMADTLIPLDITFFAADGAPVDTQRMTPCPDGNDATCPTYGSKKAYRYALERPAGTGSSGSLGGCAA